MTADKVYNISVSHHYFRLTTESIRLTSNKHCSYYSLSDVINERADRANDLIDSYDSEDMRQHLRIIPSDGEVGIEFTILTTNAASIETAALALGEALGQTILFKDAISLMMFDLIVERNATEVLTKLGLTASEADAYRVSLKKKHSNVIPIRP
ncbi:hypothetical protein QLH51_12550 [Sphingomonas sp. 2R-10]|nr:hypothetical protein [Sphingomonas sp. 2R-10]